MKSARMHEYGKPLVLEEVPVPDIQPDEILVQVKACKMCRSDAQLGVNKVQPAEVLLDLEETRPDATLLAGRYTLLDHESALRHLMPAAVQKGVDIVIGGPYSSGVLAGGAHFEYAAPSREILAKVGRIKALCAKHRIPIKAAALQFCLREDHEALLVKIPDEFWFEMRKENLVAPEAPLPVDGN